MSKNLSKRLKALIVCMACLSVSILNVSCSDDSGSVNVTGFELGHYDVATANDALDSKYFYENNLKIKGGDVDIEYVPEERDSEYGGYYYMYTSSNFNQAEYVKWKEGATQDRGTKEKTEQNVDHMSVITCLRSKDLNDWELCGAVDGMYSVYLQNTAWLRTKFWAPEVVYDSKTNKYYMYYSAATHNNYGEIDEETQYGNDSLNEFDTFQMAVFSSDTPIGPFMLVQSKDYYSGLEYSDMTAEQKATYDLKGESGNLNGKIITEKNPTINISYDLGLDYTFATIDLNPFFDDDGNLYLSFVRHVSTGHDHNCMWIMRMKDMITPDYSTLNMVGACNFEYVTDENVGTSPADRANEANYTKRNCFCIPYYTNAYAQDLKKQLEAAAQGGTKAVIANDDGVEEVWNKEVSGTWLKEGWKDEGGINEGPHMWKVGDRYFYMYSPLGYAAQNYDARQAIGDSPLGPFKKLPAMPGAVMSRGFGDYINEYMSGTGHHSMVEVDGELFCIYFAHADPAKGSSSDTDGRFYAVDRVVAYEDETYGTLLAGIGPTKTVQYKPSSFTGLKNVAAQAKIEATNCDSETIKYLNDGFVVCHEYFKEKEFVANGKTEITLTFDTPVSISALMVYNTLDYDSAFSKIDAIQFELAETPAWLDEEYASVTSCYMKDIGFNTEYIDVAMKKIRTGAASAVSFDEIKVSKITITVSQNVKQGGEKIKISDIVILGK